MQKLSQNARWPTALASSPITELLLLAEQLRAERARNERAETELARLRTEAQDAMIDAARAKGHGDVGEPVVVLLGAHQQICRSNCLPKLAALGIGVQRRSAA